MSNKQITTKDLKGWNIYHDPKYGTIFYDIYTKRGIHITRSDIKNYMFYSASLPLALMIPILLSMAIKISIPLIIVLIAVLFVAFQFLFRFLVFYKLPYEDNYKVDKSENFTKKVVNMFSKKRAILVMILSIFLEICLIIYLKTNILNGIYLYGTYLLLAFAMLLLLVMMYVIFKK